MAKKAAKSKGKADPAALVALIRMMAARQQMAAGPQVGPGGPPPWRTGRPPDLGQAPPPLLG